jgi:hypothetical protein
MHLRNHRELEYDPFLLLPERLERTRLLHGDPCVWLLSSMNLLANPHWSRTVYVDRWVRTRHSQARSCGLECVSSWAEQLWSQSVTSLWRTVVLGSRNLTSIARRVYLSTFAGDNLCKTVYKSNKISTSAVCSVGRQVWRDQHIKAWCHITTCSHSESALFLP